MSEAKIDDLTPEKAEALLEVLKQERESRLQKRLDAGEAVVVRATVVGEADPERAKAAAVEQHMANNPWDRDKAVIFDTTTIITGVPRDPEGMKAASPDLYQQERPTRAEPASPYSPPRHEEDADAEPTEFKQIKVHLPPGGYHGVEVLLGYWSVCGRTLTVRSEDGRETVQVLAADEDPVRAARALLRQDWSDHGRKPIDWSRVNAPRF